MKTKISFITLALGLGLTLTLLWTLGNELPAPALAQSGTDTIRVATTGADTAGCGSVAAPCRTVQYGVNQAAAGGEVLVAAGVYTDPAGTVVALDKTVTLRGGWNSNFSAQDPVSYPTTLDARRMGSVISITGQPGAPISPTIDGFIITRGDASSQAVKGGGLYSIYADPIIIHNVFTNNIANSVYYYTGDGGGLYLARSHGVAVIQDNVFISNTAAITGNWGQGGAIYSEYSSPLIAGNVISGNRSNGKFDPSFGGGNGGGIVVYHVMTATTVISGNQVLNNVASAGNHGTGGGMALGKGPMLIQNNTVRGNAACVGGYGSGGGISLPASAGPVTITGNLVEDNTAGMGAYTSRGGGIFLEYMLEPGPVVVQDNTIVSNTASTADVGLGGGIYLRWGYGHTIIRDNRVLSNTGSTANWAIGGGLYIVSSDVGDITGNLVENNIASTAPFTTSRVAAGGGIGIDGSAVLVRGNTVRGNVATPNNIGEGGGFYVRNSGATVEENIIEDNVAALDQTGYGGGICLYTSDDATVRRNTIQGNQGSNTDGCGGGAFIYYSSKMTLDANTILSNSGAISTTGSGVGQGGGVMLFVRDGVSCTNNIIAHNQAAGMGPAQGGGVWLRGSTIGNLATASLLHNTIADNDGAGVWVGMHATATLTNNIIVSNTVAITNAAPTSAFIGAAHTLFWGNGSVPISGSNPIVGDPDFVGGGDYHLTLGSAAIDAGIEAGVARDVDGDMRPSGAGPDVGADEISLSLLKTAPETVVLDQLITYTLILTNNNPFTVTNVVVSDTAPAGASYVSGGSYAGGVVSWTIASIAPSGGVAQVSFVVTATATVTNSQYRVVTSTEGLSTGFGPPVTTIVTTEMGEYIYLPLVLRQFSRRAQALYSEGSTEANKWQAPLRWREPGGDGLMPRPPRKPKLD